MATDAEASVDELLDAIEQGTLVLASAADGGAPDGALDTLFSSSDRLARDPDDRVGRDDLRDLRAAARPDRARRTACRSRTWAKIVDAARALADLVDDEDRRRRATSSAPPRTLRSLVRQYVS